MKLGTKIIVSFVCITLLLVVIAITFELYRSQVHQKQLEYISETSQIMMHAAEVERSLYQSLILLNAYRASEEMQKSLSAKTDSGSVNHLKNRFYRQFENFKYSHKELGKILQEEKELTEILEKLENLFYWYHAVAEDLFKLSGEEFDRANLEFINVAEPHFRGEIIPLVENLRSQVLVVQNQRIHELNKGIEEATFANRVAMTASLIFAVFVAGYIYRSIANPLNKLNKMAKKWGKGDLSERVEIDTKDEIGELAHTYNEMASSLQDNMVSKDYLTNIIDSINEALFEVSLNFKILRVNKTSLELLGYQEEELIGEHVCKVLRVCEDEALSKNENIENQLITKNGDFIPVLSSRAEIKNKDNDTTCYVYVSGDITLLKKQENKIKQSLKEKQVLLAEIHHRVKNNLALITGLLQLQEFSAKDELVRKALKDSQQRITSIALVHEMLYQNDSLAFIDYQAYLKQMIDTFLKSQSLNKKEIAIETEVNSVSLDVNQAVPCSLLINELISNSYKYSFNGKKSGRIKISMREADGCIELVVCDNGTNPAYFKNKRAADSLSIQLIETLTQQVNGKLEMDNKKDKGNKVKVKFKKQD